MSFQLSLTEVDKARAIGERALKTIELGELKERFNVWAALLNLERAHGDERSLNAMTTRALHGADPKTVYMHVASMHERAQAFAQADAAFELCCKKYRSQPDVWVAWMTSQMARGAHADGKSTLQRAVDALPRGAHADILSKFAQLEFRHGEAERGRTVFDSILANYPKRVDVWSVYMDMELKHGEAEPIGRVFERATSLRLSSKKMKFFFTRYLTYARERGSPELVAHVKEKARAFVESAGAGADE
jgi:rRNA biogenesis protein RRP5